MTQKSTPDLTDWLGLKNPPDFFKAQALGRFLGFLLSVAGLVIVIFTVTGVILMLGALTGFGPYAGDAKGDAVRNLGLVLAAIIGVPFLVWRSIVAQKQVDVAEQGHITDRLNTAVEGLGAEKSIKRQRKNSAGKLVYVHQDGKPDFSQPVFEEITQPNLEVRIGAIYSLERIAQDSKRDHIQIMEILSAYIRQNAQTEDVPLPTVEDGMADWKKWREDGQTHLRSDVDAALTVMERRSPERRRHETANDYRIGLQRSSLCKLVLDNRDFEYVDFKDAQMQGASLRWSNLKNAHFWNVDLRGADLQGADFCMASMGLAKLQGVNLWGTQMRDAYFGWAEFDQNTAMLEADLRHSAISNVDLTDVRQMSGHLGGMFGDGTVILPGGHGPGHPDWPTHWPVFDLAKQFQNEWQKWLSDPDNYRPPRTAADLHNPAQSEEETRKQD